MTVWIVECYDQHQYQGRASVHSVHATEESANKALAVAQEANDDWSDVFVVIEHDVVP